MLGVSLHSEHALLSRLSKRVLRQRTTWSSRGDTVRDILKPNDSQVCLRSSYLGSFSLPPPVGVHCIVYSLPTSSFSLRAPREGSAHRFSVDFGVRCSRLVFSSLLYIRSTSYLLHVYVTPVEDDIGEVGLICMRRLSFVT